MNFKHTNFKFEKEYPKLVRDLIPDIIAARGKSAGFRKVRSNRELTKFLLKKLVEESRELKESSQTGNMAEELADVLEVIDALVEHLKISKNELRRVRTAKRKKNGGFRRGIVMLASAR